ncbi:MAG: helix-turn-helix transcriptional regulator [Paramuribaculum sp.]|nr:helix-turn-helix transcriptional regulator [Paramuribaculum sp.]
MKTIDEITSGLNRHRSSTPSEWRKKAEWRIANKDWLRYSQRIAMMMLDRMEMLGLTQKSVAERMCCSQQYISRVLKGTENLSIETISKIEAALELDILNTAVSDHVSHVAEDE